MNNFQQSSIEFKTAELKTLVLVDQILSKNAQMMRNKMPYNLYMYLLKK